MDPFEELERMALNAIDDASMSKEEEPSHDQIANWQRLFHYSYSDAIDRIQQHRSDLARMRVSDEHWGLVQVEMEANGYDREAYEHKLQLGQTLPEPRPAKDPHVDSGTASSFIFKLEGPLSDPSVIQKSNYSPNLTRRNTQTIASTNSRLTNRRKSVEVAGRFERSWRRR